jgi:predicted phosphodiesterase
MIMFGGDPHGDFRPLVKAAVELRPAAVVVLGDMELSRPLDEEMGPVLAAGVPVFWISGNHDSDREEWLLNCSGSPSASRNLDGAVAEVGGVRIAGLGGVFRGQIWNPRYGGPTYRSRTDLVKASNRSNLWEAPWDESPGVSRRHRTSIWPEDYDRMSALRADILVLHEAPSSHRHGFPELDALAEALGVGLVVHGHHHVDCAAVLANGIRVMGVGLAGVRLDDGRTVSAGLAASPPD